MQAFSIIKLKYDQSAERVFLEGVWIRQNEVPKHLQNAHL